MLFCPVYTNDYFGSLPPPAKKAKDDEPLDESEEEEKEPGFFGRLLDRIRGN